MQFEGNILLFYTSTFGRAFFRRAMSLAFLAKKSWHTSNLSNVEKVWKAEQKAALEEKKLAEWKKNVEEERQLKELRELQAKASGTKANTTERVDWMYEGPMAASQREKTAEEYLLGKEYEEKPEDNELKKLSSQPGSLYMQSGPGTANDAFSRLNEDPMMFIKKQQKATQLSIMKNPMKMKRIKEKVEQELKERKAEKKAKKEAKKAKKASKKDKKRRGSDDNDASSSKHSRRSTSADHRHHVDHTDRLRHHSSHDTKRDRSASPPRSYRSGDGHRGSPRGRSRDRSPGRSRPRHESPTRQDHPVPLKGYGVLGAENARKCRDIDTSSLGPSRKFLDQAKEKRQREEDEKQERFKRARAATDVATKADREARLQAMLEDAKRRERALDARLRKSESDKRRENDGDGEASATQQNPTFLKDLHDAAYVHSNDSMEERLQRNKHYIQRNADSKNFMQR
ncbi:hypothetical protein, variant [Aphanomyces invadans]|uniref:CBF1-interacting co-repressor CIR N-terminal domain-containing protein n=1 Tax=Aphanomyces invadans TaxID=157072 RepID=A0A024TTZ2_9STRA|nr:hypothetical protein, variant [Aphanomyces invadans]ETV97478.1 hypothetical protein, variant [Aphanomyces invadans]|eukprot:XP_008873687.1 hypothetical protein, variant [Aphanomyces invadans]